MTSGVGNPDWQRRYVFSAQPIYTATVPPNVTTTSALQDANGFQNLIVDFNSIGTTAFINVEILWFQDAAGTISICNTEFFPVPNSNMSQKIPVMARYYKITTAFVSGAAGGSIKLAVFGTNSDNLQLLTQDNIDPFIYVNQSIGAGVNVTTAAGGMYGGLVRISLDQGVSNKWALEMDYFSPTAATWREFWSTYGSIQGIAFSGELRLPYAPVRLITSNLDTVAQTYIVSVIAT